MSSSHSFIVITRGNLRDRQIKRNYIIEYNAVYPNKYYPLDPSDKNMETINKEMENKKHVFVTLEQEAESEDQWKTVKKYYQIYTQKTVTV